MYVIHIIASFYLTRDPHNMHGHLQLVSKSVIQEYACSGMFIFALIFTLKS